MGGLGNADYQGFLGQLFAVTCCAGGADGAYCCRIAHSSRTVKPVYFHSLCVSAHGLPGVHPADTRLF